MDTRDDGTWATKDLGVAAFLYVNGVEPLRLVKGQGPIINMVFPDDAKPLRAAYNAGATVSAVRLMDAHAALWRRIRAYMGQQ